MKIDISGAGIRPEREQAASCRAWRARLRSGGKDYPGADFAGWVRLPEEMPQALLDDLCRTAEEIRERCTLLIVVGIGGSFLGAKAVIDALGGSRPGWPEVAFAGFHMSAAYHKRLLARMEKEAVCLCVISKSGRTVEPLLAYAILKEKLIGRYGEAEAYRRIYGITDARRGDLRREAEETGMKTFVIPNDVGGRYSVLTPVGLLPIAAAGHDIRKMLAGAKAMAQDEAGWSGPLLDYTLARCTLQRRGKRVEVFEFFEADLHSFGQWLVQLFGESEGKAGKGALPTCLWFSRDLHSMGQFLQQGSPVFFETVISVAHRAEDIAIPKKTGGAFAGKTLEQINACAEMGVLAAHRKAGIPIQTVQIQRLEEESLGGMIYFFEMSAALSGYLMGVNPFDQPGVEAYKAEVMGLVAQLEEQE